MLPDGRRGQTSFSPKSPDSPFIATHAAVSVDRNREEIQATARRAPQPMFLNRTRLGRAPSSPRRFFLSASYSW